MKLRLPKLLVNCTLIGVVAGAPVVPTNKPLGATPVGPAAVTISALVTPRVARAAVNAASTLAAVSL